MPYYKDLDECSYFKPWRKVLKAVGWLESGRDYPTGPVDPAFFAKLVELVDEAVQMPLTPYLRGHHHCDFCGTSARRDEITTRDGATIELGLRNVFVPAANRIVYAAPSTILHYIEKHNYAPPLEFQQSVLECPTMGSVAYYWQM